MDGSTGDRWTRRYFGLLAGGWLTALVAAAPLAPTLARKKRRRKKKRIRKPCACGVCHQCQGVACVPTPDSTRCGECGVCQDGSCLPPALNPDVHCGPCATCRPGGTCLNKPTETPCGPFSLCDEGVCYQAPLNCGLFPDACTSGADCCHGACFRLIGEESGFCFPSEPGQPCTTSEHCVEGASCVAFRCLT